MRLTLIRHAKSSWADPGRPDFERPLNERGRGDAPRMAARLAPLGLLPDRIISSPALRAISTARAFAGVLGIAPEAIELQPRIYEATPATLLDLLRLQGGTTPHLMLFGHNPGLSELARTLADCPIDEMPTCAVASLELDIRRWSALAGRCGRLEHYLYPKDGLGAPAVA